MVRRRVPLLALALVVGGLWWWAVLRLAFVPERSGLVEGAIAAGGWGLSLLPVHVAAAPGRRRSAWTRRRSMRRSTRAWSRRRSDAGSDLS
ncbi:hypothetical protein [Streptomyces purpureus]|uniref:Uncharacterized protein n=1 Tax=Streptomyces purpureus TaxID=1951 RepID=A0A918H8A3_9ACTN|nr:hypothetical protein [Streptomyces purpureus]GGT43701.1 hypothetical protein GCM10014713_41780 [Streptomyces purpureus]